MEAACGGVQAAARSDVQAAWRLRRAGGVEAAWGRRCAGVQRRGGSVGVTWRRSAGGVEGDGAMQ